jgi:PleD family two-component response regulator
VLWLRSYLINQQRRSRRTPNQRKEFHAVLLDMRMPPPDGLELARQVRASRVNASTVIVMITGEQERTLMKRAFEIGVEFFLFKPVERNKLLKLIRVAETSIERERRRFHASADALHGLYGFGW